MDKHTKQILLEKFLRNKCSEEETEQVRQLITEADTDETVNSVLEETWESLQLYPELPSERSETIFKNITSQVKASLKPVVIPNTVHRSRRFISWQIAASLTGILMVAGLIYQVFFYTAEIKEVTGFGQMATVTLPDKSVVMLNGNSSIRYREAWNNNQAREVWLEGEGFFRVVHTASHQKFVVYTSDKVAVEVLGTSFSVTKRKFGTRVVLNTGKVSLQLGEARQSRNLILKPGDLVQLKSNNPGYEKRVVNPAAYSSWTKQKLVFDNTPLPEVITMLEETYGFRVAVVDKDIYRRKVSGSTPSTDINLFLAGLEKSLNLKITQKGNQLEFANYPKIN